MLIHPVLRVSSYSFAELTVFIADIYYIPHRNLTKLKKPGFILARKFLAPQNMLRWKLELS
jgi:hypothetical protein